MITYIDLLKWFRENKEKIDDAIIRDIFFVGDAFVFEIYKRNLDKKYLYIVPGKIVFLSNNKLKKIKNKLADRLKKDFLNKKLRIYLEDDKIIRIEILDKLIYIELIPKGLVVITDSENKILYANFYKNFGSRKIFIGEVYKKPPKNFYLPKNLDEFLDIIKNSNKRDIVRCLALDLGLSKKYAEYILKNLNIDKNKEPKALSEEEIREIFRMYTSILERSEILYNDKWYKNVNDVFETMYFQERIEKEKKKIDKEREEIEKILSNQIKTLASMKEEYNKLLRLANIIKENYWIFENYNIDEIRKYIKELKLPIEVKKKNNKIVVTLKDLDNGKN